MYKHTLCGKNIDPVGGLHIQVFYVTALKSTLSLRRFYRLCLISRLALRAQIFSVKYGKYFERRNTKLVSNCYVFICAL